MRCQYLSVALCLLLCGCSQITESQVTDPIPETDPEEMLSTAPATAPDFIEETIPQTVSETIQQTVPETEMQIENSDTASKFLPWQTAYRDLLSEEFSDPKCAEFSYSLIYLDDDDIPELFINTQTEANGEIIYSYSDNHCVKQQLSRIGTTYLERTGLLYNNCGHMGYYPVTVYKLENGVFSEIASGIYQDAYDRDGKRVLYESGEPVYDYYWNDQKVSEQEFDTNLQAIFDTDSGIRPAQEYTIEKILVQITSNYQ